MNRRRRSIVLTVAFVIIGFTALIGNRIWTAQSERDQVVTHAIIGQPLPATAVVTPLLGGEARPLSDEIVGTTVVNYFASWCGPCHAENAVLLQLRAEGVRLVGVAVRDQPVATQAFLDELGDPFFRVMSDPDGTSMQALGIGPNVPQTLVVARDGEVLYRHSGPLIGTDGEAALEEIRDLAGPR